ncbi:MAG: hypothetical protein QNL04_02325 [SAR324 cluster bacterium]|nr:hypothetical protein [SAR324 cluster bacterium]
MTDKPIVFFHLDLDNATSFKYEKHSQDWKDAFKDFYGGWSKYLRHAVENRSREHGLKLQPLRFWKGLGDAQVHKAEFEGADEVFAYVLGFYDAFHQFSDYLMNRYNLGLKATAWYATFPEPNLRLQTPAGDDYIGPDLDIGFRLTTVSQSNRIILAMDLADLVSRSQLINNVTFHHVGWRSLKGVHRDTPYPIILLNGQTPIKVPIWESYLSDLTQKYLMDDPLQPEGLQKLIARYKSDLQYDRDKI